MSAPKNTENKSLSDAAENKALAPQTEDKAAAGPVAGPAAAPVADGMVEIIVAHPVPAGRIGNDKDLNPGDRTHVTAYLAGQLAIQGVARRA